MSDYPVSMACPKCKSTDHENVKSNALVAFTDDRICKSCGTRYSPPTPAWASLIFVALGLCLSGLGVAGFLLVVGGDMEPQRPILFAGALALVGGLGALGHGVFSLLRPGKV